MRKLILGTAVALSLTTAGTAQADTVTTTFDGLAVGSINGKDGWKATDNYDHKIVDVDGGKALRISNAVTSGSFGDMTFSKPVVNAASETNGNNVLVNEFTIKAPDTLVPGLAVTVSPDDGQGTRMSRVRFEDTAEGVKVIFADSTFIDQVIATLDRSVKHTVKIETTFVHGHDDDVVRVFIDGDLEIRGGSWESYYRVDEQRNPSASDRLLFRTAGTAAPLTKDKGFLFDDVMSKSYHVDNPAPLHPVVLPQGPKGDSGKDGTNGTNGADGKDGVDGTAGSNGRDGSNGLDGKNGVNGKDGVTTIIREQVAGEPAQLFGNTVRTLTVSKLKGGKLVSVKATMRGKKLPVSGRKVKVDLTGKAAGSYDVAIVAKYKKGGKLHAVRSIRTLSITAK